MFGFTTILSVSVSLLLAAPSVLAIPRPAPHNLNIRSLLSIRQSNSSIPAVAPECTTQCDKLSDALQNVATPSDSCIPSIMPLFESCFDCEVTAGAATQEFLQDTVNTFVEACGDLSHPVNNVTIVATNGGGRVEVGMFGSVYSVAVTLIALSFALL
ncbi:hypothetical protein B0H17DRAFT_1034284 [Mycena rosella]|uniref:Uncharacterized protein n=1 Tax=Mycena rosella TaxID=1033263 RepID=A0AAD7M9E0_MYCRO|nr:hypothetical protein B0H17DRAFT_1034284 [Mycena rosella]